MSIVRSFGKLLITLVAVFFVVVFSALALVLFSDINSIKPHLEKLLEDRGIHTQFGGDLGWSLYPVAGITTADVSLYNNPEKNSQQRLARVSELSFQIDLWKLLVTRNIRVNSVIISAPEIHYQVNAAGQSNWQPVLDTFATEPSSESEPSSTGTTSFELSQLLVNDLQINYDDQQAGQSLALHEVDIAVANINLQRKPMTLQTSGEMLLAPYPPIQFSLGGRIEQPNNTDILVRQMQVSLAQGSAAKLAVSGDLTLTQVNTPTATLEFAVARFNPRPWLQALEIALPEMANPNALSRLAANGKVTASSEQLEIPALQLDLDNTTINAQASVRLRAQQPPTLRSRVQVTTINLDDYLPPPAPQTSDPTETPDTALDLSFLENQDAELRLQVERAQMYQQIITVIDARVKATHNRLALNLNQAHVFNGKVSLQGRVQNTPQGAEVNAQIAATGIDVYQAMTGLDVYDQLQGNVDVGIAARGTGATTGQLQKSLIADIEVAAQELLFTAINVEQRYCDAIAKLERKTKVTQWPPHTSISPFAGRFVYRDDAITINQITALIQGMQTTASGRFVPASGEFDIPLDIAFNDFTAAQKDCPLLNAKWRSQKIPLLCKGNLDALGADICAPDYKRLSDKLEDRFQTEKDKLKDKAETRAREIREEVRDEAKKIEDKAEQRTKESREEAKDKVDEQAKDLLDSVVGEKKAEELEDKLKNLLNRK